MEVNDTMVFIFTNENHRHPYENPAQLRIHSGTRERETVQVANNVKTN